jgi:hypothetical protein
MIGNFKPIKEQADYFNYQGRFAVVPSGRRSGKTEILDSRVVFRALKNRGDLKRYFLGGPTYGQAKNLFWYRTKKLLVDLGVGWQDKSETDLKLYLPTNAEIHVIGFNEPKRFDGIVWHGGGVDEFGDMTEEVWTQHIRPALTDTGGFCDFIGVPAGRNHYYRLYKDYAIDEGIDYWQAFSWWTEQVLPMYLGEEKAREEIEQAKRDLDPKTFEQEYRATFKSFSGRAYYQYDEEIHAVYRQRYDKNSPLILCFDFNVEPGTCCIVQEQNGITRVIDEVYIRYNSKTTKVCDKVISKYGDHGAGVICYGDASGGARKSSQVAGSDWELIKKKLQPVYGSGLKFNVPARNPHVLTRVNAVNSRLRTMSDDVKLYVDPKNAQMTMRDFEGVRSDGAGGILKQTGQDDLLTHLTDGLGYYIAKEFPIRGSYAVRNQQI